MDVSSTSAPSAPGDNGSPVWHLTVSDSCVGTGMCSGIAGRYFRIGKDYRSHVVESRIAPDDAVLDAAASCPMEAIVITNIETGEVVEL